MASRVWASFHLSVNPEDSEQVFWDTSQHRSLSLQQDLLLWSQNLWSLSSMKQQRNKRALTRQLPASLVEIPFTVSKIDPQGRGLQAPQLLQGPSTSPSSAFWLWLSKMSFHPAVKALCHRTWCYFNSTLLLQSPLCTVGNLNASWRGLLEEERWVSGLTITVMRKLRGYTQRQECRTRID